MTSQSPAVFERHAELLLDEKRYVDSVVVKCLEFQLKITGIHFTALAVAAGWVFTRDSNARYLGPSLLIIVALSCFGSAQSLIINALMLHYARYKHFVLARQFVTLLDLRQSPLQSYAELANSLNPSRRLAAFGSVLSSVIAVGVNLAALSYAFLITPNLWLWCLLAAFGLVCLSAFQIELWRAQTRTYAQVLAHEA